MKHRLFIVEGLPCSGKSSVSALIARWLEAYGPVCHVDEGSGDHPADYEYHALAPVALTGGKSRVVPLAAYSGEQLKQLLPYKIYDALPWEAEQPLMLDKWRQFAASAAVGTTYVFNCVLLQNPMCETMMRFGFPEDVSARHIRAIADIIAPLEPVVIYLRSDDVAESVLRAAPQRPGWLDAVIDYHTHGAYGVSIGAQGFDGYIRCLQERQARELRILERLPLRHIVLDDPHRSWADAHAQLRRLIESLSRA